MLEMQSTELIEDATPELLEVLECAERHIRGELHSAHVPMQGKDLASIQEAIRKARRE